MKCPACENSLTKIIEAGVNVLVCKNVCGGLWFSQPQLKRIGKLKPGSGVRLLNIVRADGVKVYRGVEHVCPQCKTTLLFRHFFSKEYDTGVNQCAKCGGFWIDIAGLAKLQFINKLGKQKAVENYFAIILGQKISGIHLLNEDVARAVKNIVEIFQFLCPEGEFPEVDIQFEY